MKDKIIEHFVNADADTMTNGLGWYQKAHEEAMVISQVFNKPLEIVVGVIAALSPRNKWARNISDTWDLISAPSMDTKVCTFGNQKRKALAIIGGANIIETLSGPKTVSFFNNIMYYESSYSVTVDLWTFRSVDLEVKQKYFNDIELAYQEAADEIGIMPSQLQAVCWIKLRGTAV